MVASSTQNHLPAQAEAWCSRVDDYLHDLDKQERRDIIADLRSHISEGLNAGVPLAEVLARLGQAEDVAVQALDGRHGIDELPRGYWNRKRLVQFAAFVFAVAAALVVVFLPGSAEVETDENGVLLEVASPTLLDSVGPSLLAILAIPIILVIVPLLMRRTRWQGASVLCAVLLAVGVILGSASIGYFFAPALICSVTALFLRPRHLKYG